MKGRAENDNLPMVHVADALLEALAIPGPRVSSVRLGVAAARAEMERAVLQQFEHQMGLAS